MKTTRVLMITSLVLLTLPEALAQEPWQTPEGRACIDRWIRDTTSRLNSYNGDTEFNSHKPWSINQYGLFVGRGIRSNYEPDNWVQYSANRYHWMWGNYTSELHHPDWNNVAFNRAGLVALRYFVRSCVGGSGGGGVSGSIGGGGGGASTAAPQSCGTTSGAMTFTGATSGRIANYGDDQGRIIGNLAGGSIDGYWVEASSSERCSRPIDGSYYWGRIIVRFNGTRFDGKWSYCDAAPTRSWTGDCYMGGGSSSGGGLSAAPLSGAWTSSGWGSISLKAQGTSFTGTYSDTYMKPGKGTIELHRKGNEWAGTWAEPAIGRRGGLFDIKISADGKRINGSWNVTNPGSRGGTAGGTFVWVF